MESRDLVLSWLCEELRASKKQVLGVLDSLLNVQGYGGAREDTGAGGQERAQILRIFISVRLRE